MSVLTDPALFHMGVSPATCDDPDDIGTHLLGVRQQTKEVTES